MHKGRESCGAAAGPLPAEAVPEPAPVCLGEDSPLERAGQDVRRNSRCVDFPCAPPYTVKNTFVHVERPLDEYAGSGLPARSVSVPRMFAPSPGPVASLAKPCLALSTAGMQRAANEPALNFAAGNFEEDTASVVAMPPSRATPATRCLPSAGAALHGSGLCKPCAWFWKPSSCDRGAACGHCHLCLEGELYRRRKIRRAVIKAGRARVNGA